MIFISYSSSETEYVRKLKRVLSAHNIPCWLACDSILPGDDYAERVLEAIRTCDAFVLILSKASQKSIWVPKELDIALNLNKLVIPFHIDNSEIEDLFVFRLINVQRIEAYGRMAEASGELISRIQNRPNSVPSHVLTIDAKRKGALRKILPLFAIVLLAVGAGLLLILFPTSTSDDPSGHAVITTPVITSDLTTTISTVPAPTQSVAPSPEPTPTLSPSPTPEFKPTFSPTPTSSPSPTPEPEPTASPTPTLSPPPTTEPEPTAVPTEVPVVDITSGQYHPNGYCWIRWLPVEGAQTYILERRRVKLTDATFEPVENARIDEHSDRVVGKDYTVNRDSLYAYRVQVQLVDGSVIYSKEFQILTGD